MSPPDCQGGAEGGDDVRRGGSVSAPLTGQATGAPVTYDGVTFTVTAGSTAFVADDRFYFEVVPPAETYTLRAPVDITSQMPLPRPHRRLGRDRRLLR